MNACYEHKYHDVFKISMSVFVSGTNIGIFEGEHSVKWAYS